MHVVSTPEPVRRAARAVNLGARRKRRALHILVTALGLAALIGFAAEYRSRHGRCLSSWIAESPELTGTWRNVTHKSDYGGAALPPRLLLESDGSFGAASEARHPRAIWGRYNLDHDRLSFVIDGERVTSPLTPPGALVEPVAMQFRLDICNFGCDIVLEGHGSALRYQRAH